MKKRRLMLSGIGYLKQLWVVLAAVLCIQFSANALPALQQTRVSGKVLGAGNEPLAGVT